MGRFIVKIKDRYFEWSTIVDAPITKGMSKRQLEEYIKAEYGRQGLEKLAERLNRVESTGTSAHGETLETVLSHNRAGPNESEISAEVIYRLYCPMPPE